MVQLIDLKLCGAAIDECDTGAFENFVSAFHGALVGTSFIPLGGMHDGGADGFEEKIYESQARAGTFLQASKTEYIERKIRGTLKRLVSADRSPKLVLFYFAIPYGQIDLLEEKFSNEFDITVKIRTKQFIEININHSVDTAQAFVSYLRPCITHFLGVGANVKGREFPFEAKTLCAFLGQEVDRRRGNATILTATTDSLILWSLEGTDPQTNQFMTRDEILEKIESAIPTAKQFIRSVIDDRLRILSSKANPTGREISFHRKRASCALRFEERQKLIDENAEEISLYNDVLDSIREGVRAHLSDELLGEVDLIAKIVQSCVEDIFRKQGIVLGLYIVDNQDEMADSINIIDDIDRRVDELGRSANHAIMIKEAVSGALRKLIYAPTERQRDLLRRLSHTYFVLFALKNEPKIVEYFNSLAGNLILYVGSDLIIKSLSEYHLPSEAQMVTNTLRIIKGAGAQIIMSEAALEEVFTHLHASTLEFENHYSEIESQIDLEFVSIIDRILIRAYFYARLGLNVQGKPPSGWKGYIGQFADYVDIRRNRNRDALRMYLCDRFAFDYESKKDMIDKSDRDNLSKLTFELARQRSKGRSRPGTRATVLAYNDALHVVRVYSKRNDIRENSAPNQFGYRTWWLTHEKAVQRAAAVTLPGMPRFIMRPEFLLNYIGLMPSSSSVASSYSNIFPTVLGVTLSKRADPGLIHKVLQSAKEAHEVDNSRAKAKLNQLIDRLKTDRLRLYENEFDEW